jgi:NTE family protein
VIGIALLVVVIGTPARGAAEEALRRGWVLAAVCFAAVAISSVLLGRARHLNAAADEFESPLRVDPPASGSTRGIVSLPAELPPAVDGEADPLGALPLFRGLDPAALTELRDHAEQVELEAGSYLFTRATRPILSTYCEAAAFRYSKMTWYSGSWAAAKSSASSEY